MILARPAILQIDGNELTDHNREPLGVDVELLQDSVRTAFGHMRRFYKAQKSTFDVTWTDTPRYGIYTVDKNWGGQELKDFYRQQIQPVTVEVYGNEWNLKETYTMLMTSFNFAVIARRDIERWSFSLSLEEV